MQRTISSGLKLTPDASQSEAASILSTDHNKVDILWLSGPNQSANEHAQMQSLLRKLNLTHVVYGDGDSTLSRHHIKKIITERLTSNSHIFFNGHGNYLEGKHFIQIGNTHPNETDEFALSSHDLLYMAQKISPAEYEYKQASPKKTLHIATCHAGAMRNEIKPGSEDWQKSYLMLYSGKKQSTSASTYGSLKASLQYLETCKQKQIEADPLDLFLHAIHVQGDCITLLGGELQAPLISHAPKTPKDLSLQERKNRIKGNDADLLLLEKHRLNLYETLKLTDAKKTNQLQAILFARLERHDIRAIKEILNTAPDLIHCKDHNGSDPFIFACEEENIEIINLMLAYGADLETETQDQETPLLISIMQRNLAITIILLKHGASVSSKNNENENALFIATAMGQKTMVQLLLKFGAANFIDQPNRKGKTALMNAAKNGDLAITTLLLQAGAKTRLKNNKGQTALSIANDHHHHGIAELIMQSNKQKNRPSISTEIHKLPDNF